MLLEGHVENGQIVIDEPTMLPEGAKVRVQIVPAIIPGRGDWETVLAATWGLLDYDYQAQIDQDACDLQDMKEMQERMK
jgi:hypothetical protein